MSAGRSEALRVRCTAERGAIRRSATSSTYETILKNSLNTRHASGRRTWNIALSITRLRSGRSFGGGCPIAFIHDGFDNFLRQFGLLDQRDRGPLLCPGR